MKSLPSFEAEIVFLREEEGGRRSPPFVGYRPHIVLQDRSVRVRTIDECGTSNESYLGIEFVQCPNGYANGHSGRFEMVLMYHPRVDYEQVVTGATFTIREGGRIVGHGAIQSRKSN